MIKQDLKKKNWMKDGGIGWDHGVDLIRFHHISPYFKNSKQWQLMSLHSFPLFNPFAEKKDRFFARKVRVIVTVGNGLCK